MELSLKKRLAGFAAAGALALAVAPMAAFGVGALTADPTISVSGLDADDSAVYYKIVEQNSSTNAWQLTSAVDSDSDGKIDGSDYTIDDLVITGDPTSSSTDREVINADMANAIAAAVTTNHASSANMTVADGTATAGSTNSPVGTGLYMVVATPAKKDVIYKPVFVSADYDQTEGKNTNTFTLVADPAGEGQTASDYHGNTGVFKKSQLSIDKQSGTAADTQQDVAVGDTVDFTIKVPLVTYTKNYTDPQFKITDTLSTGLQLVTGSETVSVEGKTVTKNADYTVAESGTSGFTVTFLNDNPTAEGTQDGILYTMVGSPTVTITYKATVTSAAAAQVNQMDNTAKLNFSNEPTDTTGAGELTDKTRHYTFDIDGSAFGSTSGQTSELRKIGLDADGNEVYTKTTTELANPPEKSQWLEGAEFELTQVSYYKTDAEGTLTAEATNKVIKFNGSNVYAADGTNNPKSDENGYIPMKGLDAGVYTLKEISAPLGWSFDPSVVYTITITPTYTTEAADANNAAGNGDLILSKYTIQIADNRSPQNSTTSEYTVDKPQGSDIPYELTATGASITATTATNGTTLINNKKLGILPATGGSGIYFYVGIGALIMGLALFLGLRGRKKDGSRA